MDWICNWGAVLFNFVGWKGAKETHKENAPRQLPMEILDMIVELIDPSISCLLVSKHWYSVLIKRRLQSLYLSTKMVQHLPHLSPQFMEIIKSHTKNMIITLHPESTTDKPRMGLYSISLDYHTSNLKLNQGLHHLSQILPFSHSLHSFEFKNYTERESSWTSISAETFTALLAALSSLPLDYVRLDMPGAPFENRSLFYQPFEECPHACDIIRQSFPDTRVLHVRLREICPEVFKANKPLPRLEKLIIHLELEPASWHELELDSSAVHCGHSERYGEELVSSMLTSAKTLCLSGLAPKIEMVGMTWMDFERGLMRVFETGAGGFGNRGLEVDYEKV